MSVKAVEISERTRVHGNMSVKAVEISERTRVHGNMSIKAVEISEHLPTQVACIIFTPLRPVNNLKNRGQKSTFQYVGQKVKSESIPFQNAECHSY